MLVTEQQKPAEAQHTHDISSQAVHHKIQSFELGAPTPDTWTQCVMANFNTFLLDHAACEKKASGMAVSMISHYPDRVQLVSAMADLAVEEMSHYREVIRLIQARGMVLTKDEKDPYIAKLRNFVSSGTDAYFLDRLLMGSIVEARGAERFALIADALKEQQTDIEKQDKQEDSSLYAFYSAIAKSEARHYMLFLELAHLYFDQDTIATRLDQWITFETDVMHGLAIRAALH